MKKFFVSFVIFTALIFIVSCGGSDSGDKQTYCEENADK